MTEEPTRGPSRRGRSRMVAAIAAGALALGALGATAISAMGDDGGTSGAAPSTESPYVPAASPAAGDTATPVQEGDGRDCPENAAPDDGGDSGASQGASEL
jgi:hypothetical protein